MDMTNRLAVGSNARSIRFRQVLCLVLVGFFLYNPFMSLIHSYSGITVHHLSRNRATVGAGELQNFSPQSKVAEVNVLSAEALGHLVVMPTEIVFPLATEFVPPGPAPEDFSSNLFFRPPPSL